MASRKKCKCAELPDAVEGTIKKGPSRHLVELEQKSPPPALKNMGLAETGVSLSERYPVYLTKCEACNQIWQCDGPTGVKVYCVPENWTPRCFKLETAENWQEFDCTPLRIQQLVVKQGGHSENRCQGKFKKLLGLKVNCKNKALKGRAFCEYCQYQYMKEM